jgi:hypothetical protein
MQEIRSSFDNEDVIDPDIGIEKIEERELYKRLRRDIGELEGGNARILMD